MINILLIFLGGGIGCVLRHFVGLAAGSSSFPWATLAINAIGSLSIGLFGGWATRFSWSEALRLSLMTGLCGGFTTFSTFSKESITLAESGRWSAFATYTFGSVTIGIAAVALGYWIARH